MKSINVSNAPHMKTYIDYSVCEDTFDEPNLEWYCSKEGYLGDRGLGKLIDIGLSSFQKCDIIPKWCPEKKKIRKTVYLWIWQLSKKKCKL